MGRKVFSCALVFAGWTLAQTARPQGTLSVAEQATALKEIRDYALNYIKRLPDYTCTQVTQRTSPATHRTPGSLLAGGRPETDVIEEQLSFVDHREIHKITRINGRQVSSTPDNQLTGIVSRGEFGSLLGVIFEPTTGADIQFDRLTMLNGRRVYAFTFRVPKTRGYGIEESGRTILVAYKGLLYADVQTKAVMRIRMSCIDIPADSRYRAVELTLDYKATKVAGKEFILPSHYRLVLGTAAGDATNEADYTSYRRFNADAKIEFERDAP